MLFPKRFPYSRAHKAKVEHLGYILSLRYFSRSTPNFRNLLELFWQMDIWSYLSVISNQVVNMLTNAGSNVIQNRSLEVKRLIFVMQIETVNKPHMQRKRMWSRHSGKTRCIILRVEQDAAINTERITIILYKYTIYTTLLIYNRYFSWTFFFHFLSFSFIYSFKVPLMFPQHLIL